MPHEHLKWFKKFTVSPLYIALQGFIGTTHFQKGKSQFVMSREARPTTTRMRKNIARVADILKEDRWSSCRLIAEQMGIPKSIVQQILREDLQKRNLCVWFVPRALTAKQKEQRHNHTYELIETIERNLNFLDSIITSDESWCFAYDLETKCRSSKWCVLNTLPSKTFWFQKSRVKTMLILFFESKGLIHHEYVPEDQTVSTTFYVQVWIICVSVLPVWGQKCGENGSSFFSTIVRIHTLQRSPSSFWPKKE